MNYRTENIFNIIETSSFNTLLNKGQCNLVIDYMLSYFFFKMPLERTHFRKCPQED